MKRNIIIGCIAAALGLSACDNYLDLVPKGESVLNQTSDYLGLIEDVYGYPIQSEWYLCGEATSHNMELLENYSAPLNSAAFYWDEEFDRAAYMIATGSDDMYTMCYKKISNFNIIIQNINDSEGSEEDKRYGMAQAKIMRAYAYFYLINTFAKPYNPATAEQDRGIILREDFDMEAKGVQSTVADAYRLIQRDIEAALPHLPHVAMNTFRPDKSFGYALKAKVHLFKREFDEALQASLDGIKEAEGEGRHRLWNMNTEYQAAISYMSQLSPMYTEEMMEYGMPMYSMFRMMAPMIYFNHPYEDAENLLSQNGLTQFDPSPNMVRKPVMDLYVPKEDLRYTFYLGTMPTRPTAEPGSVSLSLSAGYHWNPAGIKLSEVYLMAAECYARRNDKENAMKYVNEVRKNRIIAKYYVALTAADDADAMRIVREERKRELLFTSNGFFDMRRFCTEFNETLTREIGGETYTLQPGSHLLTFPFPVSAMQNSNLIQNSK